MVKPFATKRCKRRGRNVLILFSISFFIISCGIPSYFYMHNGEVIGEDISYYNFDNKEVDLESEITFSIFNNSIYNISEGPSLVYLYMTVQDDIDINSIKSKCVNSFVNNYQNSGNGKPIVEDEILTFQSNSIDYTLYKFHLFDNLAVSNALNVQNPTTYGVTYNGTISPSPVTSKLKVEKNISLNSEYNLVLNETVGTNYNVSTQALMSVNDIILKRYNGDNFPSVANSDEDFLSVEEESPYYVLVFTALNVSTGDFSNILWSDLNYMGSIYSK